MIPYKWDPARQMGWYRLRNERICALHRVGASTAEIAVKFNLRPAAINQIIRACSEVSNGG